MFHKKNCQRRGKRERVVMRSIIAVSGYGCSGSGVVLDFLKECSGIEMLADNFEFRLLRDPYGVLDLEDALVGGWDYISSNKAIQNFLRFAWLLHRNGKGLRGYGARYGQIMTPEFYNITEDYINSLTDFTIQTSTYPVYIYDAWTQIIMSKIWRKIKRRASKPLRFAKPTANEFQQQTNKYLNMLFDLVAKHSGNRLVLDQAIPAENILRAEQAFNYFDEIKMIIVDRDPRDIFAQNRKEMVLGKKGLDKAVATKFTKFYRRKREDAKLIANDKRIIKLQFEDFVYNYDEVRSLVLEHLDVKPEQHVAPKRHFNPQLSKENIGLWRSYSHQDEIDIIACELSEYCYEQKK